ncbi:MAG: DsbA family protein [Pseudomonadota bacterium]
MSLKTLLLPIISRRLFSRERLLHKRAKAERKRVKAQAPHQLHYFHQVDDPYSALVAGVLPTLLARYDIELVPHVVSAPPDAAAPERDKLVAYSRVDAERLAQHYDLSFRDPGRQPSATALAEATALLVGTLDPLRFAALAGPLMANLWQLKLDLRDGITHPQAWVSASTAAVNAHLHYSDQLRATLGHYLGGTFFYAGEWYWGIDRLYHLEQRLQDLGAQKPGVSGLLFAPAPDLQADVVLNAPPDIDFYFSFRSPYSAIVAPRIFALGRRTGAKVNLRFVLPMVMRGLPVPADKRQYISHDTAREAFVRGIPFGCLNDPVGRPTERGLALIPYAERIGQGEAYVLSFMRGVWAEGIDAGSDSGLRRIAERAGLNWTEAQQALRHDNWRLAAERNRTEMFGLGLWGVPSFRVGTLTTWGQDRLWAVEDALLKSAAQPVETLL